MKTTAGQNQLRHLGSGILPAIAVALIPKCPLCWMALMSILGVGSVIEVGWLRPLTVLFLALFLFAMLFRASRRRFGYKPFLLGLAAALVIYLCKFTFDFNPGFYGAVAVLFGASIWNSWGLRRAEETCDC